MAEGCIVQGEVQTPREGDKPFVFVEKRKGGNQKDNQDKPPSSKEMNKSEANSHGLSEKKPS
jgi:hypothetical protein